MIFAVLTITSPLPIEEIQRRIDARGREWRESSIPRKLRNVGVTGIRTRRKNSRFEIQTQGWATLPFRRGPFHTRLVGELLRNSDGTTLVRMRHRAARKFYFFAPIWIGWNAYIARGGGVLWYMLLAAFAFLPFAIGDAMAEDERQGLLDVLREVAGLAPDAPFEVTRSTSHNALNGQGDR